MSTRETPLERLERLRAEKAAREAAAVEAQKAADIPVVEVGDVIHAVATGLTIPRTASLWGGDAPLSLTRGDRVVVTEAMLEASRDRNGNLTWPTIVHDPDRQMRRWGRIHLAAGEPPEGMMPWTHGSPDWAEARETARRAAWAEPSPERRAEALAEVHRVYGPPPTTSTVTATYRGDADAEAQQQRIAASAATGSRQLGHGVGA